MLGKNKSRKCGGWIGLLWLAVALPAFATTYTPSVTPTRTPTPGTNNCCQCDLTASCGTPVDGGCPDGCVLFADSACGIDGSCTSHTQTPTPTATSTPTQRPNCAYLFPNGPTSIQQNSAVGCAASWQCMASADGDASYLEHVGTSVDGTDAYDLYALDPIAPNSDSVLEVNVSLSSRNAGSVAGYVAPAIWLDDVLIGDNTLYPVPNTYVQIRRTFLTNPAHGNIPWTWDDIGNLRAGVRHFSPLDAAMRTTRVRVEVCWGVPSPTRTPSVTPTASATFTPTSTATNTPSPTAAAPLTPTSTPTNTSTTTTPVIRDAVVLPVKPLNVILGPNTAQVTRRIRVKVRNADDPAINPVGAIHLSVERGDCPAGMTISRPDFHPNTPEEDTVILSAGRQAVASVWFTIHAGEFTKHNYKAPSRCTLQLSVSTVGADLDLTLNNRVPVEINVRDRHHPASTAIHETAISSVSRITISVRTVARSRRVHPRLINADVVDAQPGDSVTLTVDNVAQTDGSPCPWLSASQLDADTTQPGNQPSVTVSGGGTRRARIEFEANRSANTPNQRSPARCIVLLRATGPSASELSPGLDPSNNTTQLVVDVIDKNDF